MLLKKYIINTLNPTCPVTKVLNMLLNTNVQKEANNHNNQRSCLRMWDVFGFCFKQNRNISQGGISLLEVEPSLLVWLSEKIQYRPHMTDNEVIKVNNAKEICCGISWFAEIEYVVAVVLLNLWGKVSS